MGNWMIINASPRAPRSNSKRYAQMVSSHYKGTTVYCPLTKNNHRELLAQMDSVSDLLFVFPLYADALPGSAAELPEVPGGASPCASAHRIGADKLRIFGAGAK